jgi:hypothetical protein
VQVQVDERHRRVSPSSRPPVRERTVACSPRDGQLDARRYGGGRLAEDRQALARVRAAPRWSP